MNSDEVLKAIAAILAQYKEEDIDGEPIPVDCDIRFAGSCHYRWYGDKFDHLRYKVDPAFTAAVDELKAKGYSVGYGYGPKETIESMLKRSDEVKPDSYYIVIYGEEHPGFTEYKGYKVGHRTRPPTFI